jgi:hypothetical protein
MACGRGQDLRAGLGRRTRVLRQRSIQGVLLCALLLIGFGCETGQQAERYSRDGKVYGVTQGLFRGRWWNYYERGVSFSDGRFWGEAGADLRKALGQRDEDQRRARTYGMHFVDYFPHRELGVVLFHQGLYPEAIAELEASLKTVKTAKAEYYLDRARESLIQKQGADRDPPQISIQAPVDGALTNGFSVLVEGTVTDDTYVKEVQVNGAPIRLDLAATEVSFRKSVSLTPGQNTILVLASDLSGKDTLVRRKIRVDRQGPILSIDEPEEGTSAQGTVTLKGHAYDASGLEGIRVNGRDILQEPAQELELDHPLTLPSGTDRLVIEAWDRAGNRTMAEILFSERAMRPPRRLLASRVVFEMVRREKKDTMEDTAPPAIALKGWTEEQTVFLDQAYLEGNASDEEGVRHLAVNGQQILRRPGKRVYFSHLARLEEGDNRFTIEAEDASRNRTERQIDIHRKLQRVRELGSRMTVALLPFERKGEPGLAGEALEDILLGTLLERGRFDMVERQRLEEVLREQRLSQTELADPDAAVRVGKILAANGVLMGSVLGKESSLEIFARVVDTESSLILTGVDVYGEDVDPQVLRELCQGLILKICDELPMAEGLVVQVKGKRMILDIGAETKVKKGMRLIVFKEGEPILHPVTGKVLGADVEELGHGRIETVQPQMSYAEILEKEAEARIKPMHNVITQ